MADKMEPIVFAVSEVFFPAIYKPKPFAEPRHHGDEGVFGLAVNKHEVPDALLEHLDLDPGVPSRPWIGLNGRRPPAVIADRDLGTVLQCADAANLSRDELFTGIPMNLAVQPFTISNMLAGLSRRASVSAVQVKYDDVVRRYDEICAKYFADPSMPLRPKQGHFVKPRRSYATGTEKWYVYYGEGVRVAEVDGPFDTEAEATFFAGVRDTRALK